MFQFRSASFVVQIDGGNQQAARPDVALENYTEPRIGAQFNDRGTAWFVALRGLGYEHIYFLQGRGVTDPEGLPTIFQYD